MKLFSFLNGLIEKFANFVIGVFGVASYRANAIKKFIKISFVSVFAIIFIAILIGAWGSNENGKCQIIEAFYTGNLSTKFTPGVYPKYWADTYTYNIQDDYVFSRDPNDTANDNRIQVRFNDGGTAWISGSVRFAMPRIEDQLIKVHKHFRGYDGVVKECVLQLINESIILTAALISSEESYTTKRSMFSEMSRDQVESGIFMTEQKIKFVKDMETGDLVRKESVEVMRNAADNSIVRKENPLKQYGIDIVQFIVKDIDYEPDVQDQIKLKREALQEITTAKAAVEKAIQDSKTAEEQGKKAVTEEEYKARQNMERSVVSFTQEKDSAITVAEGRYNAAKLNRQQSEQYKIGRILEADGISSKRRAIMISDGALAVRLETYGNIIKGWSDAYPQHRPTSEIEVGGYQNNGYALLMRISSQVQKDLGLDLTFKPFTNKK